jgi:hypothetical protein
MEPDSWRAAKPDRPLVSSKKNPILESESLKQRERSTGSPLLYWPLTGIVSIVLARMHPSMAES